MTAFRHFLTVFTLVVGGCASETQMPLKRDILTLQQETATLICQVRSLSDARGLSFHYGTSAQPHGTMVTFRLIGEGFEIVLVNPEEQHKFDLSVYERPKGRKDVDTALHAYREFKQGLASPVPQRCQNLSGS